MIHAGGKAAAVLAVTSLLATGCAGPLPATSVASTESERPYEAGDAKGYIPRGAMPDSRALLPPPPAPGSAAHAADEESYRATLQLHGGPRWQLAIRDAEYRFPQAVRAFSCALGVPIDEQATPAVYTLMRRSFIDAANVNAKAGALYRRPLPFIAHNQPMCMPELEASYRKRPNSYPSNNATIGWVWALVLSGLAPDRTLEVMRRGASYGDHRVLCGVHWDSDVVAGRTVGAALYAQLQGNDEFRAQAAAARRELQMIRESAGRPRPDCALESAALGSR